MRYILLTISVFLLAACSTTSDASETDINPEFKSDVDQILEMTDSAYEDRRDLNEDEIKLFDQFTDKYLLGRFTDSEDNEYVMSDAEKVIANDISKLDYMTSVEETLSSEEDVYEGTRKLIDEYIESGEVSETYKDYYPTYQEQIGLHEGFKKHSQQLFETFDPVVNGTQNALLPNEEMVLENFLIDYSGVGFEYDNEFIAHNEESKKVYNSLQDLQIDLEIGSLSVEMRDTFNEAKSFLND